MAQPLSEFISGTLDEIAKGINAARSKGIVVAPGTYETNLGHHEGGISMVRFEVEVSSELSGDTGIKVLSIADLSGSAAKKSGHRITFEVPVHFWAEWKETA
ncbi:MAG: hypothetical protein AAFQ32_11080 [Pseudomonadota bacterium]